MTNAAAQPLVVAQVEWIDAAILASRWADREEVLTETLAEVKGLIRSAGLLVSSDDEGIVLAVSHNPNNDDIQLSLFIPNACIRKMSLWPAATEVAA